MNKKLIPIFFASDDNYLPYLDVAISSLIEHTSQNNFYSIYILNTGLKDEYKARILLREQENVKITFYDMSDYIEGIKDKFKAVMHFGIATYYRLFIQSLFPQYSKVLYLDCDIVVLRDVAELYDIDLEGNIMGGAVEQFILNTPEYSFYTKNALGIDSSKYVNAGILIMDLEQFRQNKIEQKFSYLIKHYNFELIDCDQAYLNFLCMGKVKILPAGWNKTNFPINVDSELNIAHFALSEKPWQAEVKNGEYFWHYARKSKFYDEILAYRQNFTQEALEKKRQAELNLRKKAVEIANSYDNMYKKLVLGVLRRAFVSMGLYASDDEGVEIPVYSEV
ncbi:MAG: glycosyltransferase family 8 protein [Clostridia bacterium]|nr:glycosyltransferase family 8 protein [Clostridia bacterium]